MFYLLSEPLEDWTFLLVFIAFPLQERPQKNLQAVTQTRMLYNLKVGDMGMGEVVRKRIGTLFMTLSGYKFN